MRDHTSSPDPTEDSAASLIQADPSPSTPNKREFDTGYPAWASPSPSMTKSRFLRPEPPRSKPLFRGFERPSFPRIAILTVLCLVTYPAFYTLKRVAKNRSLFVVRLLVSIWCSGVGFALGYILLAIGAQHHEAASKFTLVGHRDFLRLFQIAWATVIHMSHEGGGMKLRNLARSSRNLTSFLPAFHLFRSRFGSRETSRRSRKSYESVPGSSSALPPLTLLQQATLVPVLSILRRPHHTESPTPFPIGAHNRYQNYCQRTCYRPPSPTP